MEGKSEDGVVMKGSLLLGKSVLCRRAAGLQLLHNAFNLAVRNCAQFLLARN